MTKRRKYITIGILVLIFFWLLSGWYQGMKDNKLGGGEPEFALVTVGDLDVPISATGSVEPKSRAELKCKASGTVQKVYFDAGDMVHKGDLLVELDPVDEQRTVDNAQAEVSRVRSSLMLSKLEAEKIQRDWPQQVLTALGNLESIRARLQGSVVSFKRQDAIRRNANPQEVTLNVVDESKITPVDLKPKDLPLVGRAARQIALATAEALEVDKLVEYGKKVINENKVMEKGNEYRISHLEYQDALITVWQAEANLMMTLSDVYNAVNMYYVVEQAKTRVMVAEEALKIAEVSLAQAKQRLTDTKVYAPQDGLIQEVYIKEGQIISSGVTTVTGGTPLLTLAEVEKLYVEADVDEADIGRVRELAPVDRSARLVFASLADPEPVSTQPELTKENLEEMEMLRSLDNVNITVEAFREDKFTGKVDRVYPNPKNVSNIVTYKVRILLTSDNRSKLMLGMHANVEFTSRKLTDVLLVAVEAIKSKNEEHGVYIEGNGPGAKPIFVPVKVGLTDSEMIELKTDKLKKDDKVYTKLPVVKEVEENDD
jgi:multidrug efflux pump subunit AcrA (membrane-fusion protein)